MYQYGYDYDFGFDMLDSAMEFMAGFGFALIGIAVLLVLLMGLFGIVTYVLSSVGLHTIARRRGIHHAWLAWIPVAKNWVLGCISDQYQYVVKGKVRNRRKVLLILSVVHALVSGVSSGVNLSNLIAGIENPGLGGGLMLIGFSLISLGVSLTVLVFYYISMFDLYTSCVPVNNVLYLVFSILFRVTEPFFLFFSRKKDEGMPPRRDAVQTFTPEEMTDGPELL